MSEGGGERSERERSERELTGFGVGANVGSKEAWVSLTNSTSTQGL